MSSASVDWLLDIHKRYGLILLFWLGLLLKGAKMPGAFFFWASFVVLFIAIRTEVIVENLSLKGYWKELLLAFYLGVSQVFSLDSAASFYYTTQGFILLLLWVSLKADPEILPDLDVLMFHLSAMALLCAVVSLPQLQTGMMHGKYDLVYGLLPLNPIFNAAWIAAVSVLLFARLLEAQSPLRYRSLAWGAIVSLILVTLLLPARSSVLALAVGLLYAGLRILTVRRVILVLLFITALMAVAPSRWIQARLTPDEGNHRGQLWALALRGAADHPFVGYGLGNFEMVYQRYAFPIETDRIRFARTAIFAQNEYLQVATDVGIPAFCILFAGALGVLLAPSARVSIGQRPAKAAFIVLAVLAVYSIVWHLPLLAFLTIVLSRFVLNPLRASPARVHGCRPVLGIGFGVIIMTFVVVSAGWCAVRERFAQHRRWDLIVRINAGDASAWEQWAGDEKDPARALDYYAHAAAISPENPYFHESLGLALEASHRVGNYPPALEEYLRVLQLSPNRALDVLAAGRVLFILGETSKACEWFKNALRIEPHYWECDLWISRCLYRMRKPGKAAVILRHLKERRESYQAWRKRVYDDLPVPIEGPSSYEQMILSYDDAVVNRELRATARI